MSDHPILSPADIIGANRLARLQLAGYEVVPRPNRSTTTLRWTCQHCGAVHAPRLGQQADVYANFARVWHRPCVPPDLSSWQPPTDRLPMLVESVPVPR